MNETTVRRTFYARSLPSRPEDWDRFAKFRRWRSCAKIALSTNSLGGYSYRGGTVMERLSEQPMNGHNL
jgi:hypothetical protein